MIARIGRRRTFDELRRHGRRVRHGSVRLSFLPQESEEIQVAFAIGRSFGNAVERNRGRRRLRAALIEALGRVEPDGDTNQAKQTERLAGAFLLTGSRGLLTNDFARLVSDVEACLMKLTSEKCST